MSAQFVYTVRELDYDDYPRGGVLEVVGPFDTYEEAYWHGQANCPNKACTVEQLTEPESALPTLVAVCGRMYSGKDTLGEHLVKNHGYVRIGFADAVKEFAVAIDPILYGENPPVHLSDLRRDGETDLEVCNRLKVEVPEVRRLLQAIGTDAGTKLLGKQVWVNLVLRKALELERVVITDCRFPYEADAVRAAGGMVLRTTRPGVGGVSDHPSETEVANCSVDVDVFNSGTVDDYLKVCMRELYSWAAVNVTR